MKVYTIWDQVDGFEGIPCKVYGHTVKDAVNAWIAHDEQRFMLYDLLKGKFEIYVATEGQETHRYSVTAKVQVETCVHLGKGKP